MKKDTRHDDAFDYPELVKMSTEDFYRIYKTSCIPLRSTRGLTTGSSTWHIIITRFIKHTCHFNPKKSRFSNYLATMVRNACRNVKHREPREL